VFKTLIFSTFSGSFHQINKRQPHFCVLVYLLNNKQRVHLSICARPAANLTCPAGPRKKRVLGPDFTHLAL